MGAGEIMLFADLNYQDFDWWHEQIDGAYMPETNELEYFEHEGLFKNKSLNLGVVIGLNDYWNVSISQLFSERCMEWEGPVDDNGNSLTVHHRSECSSSDFYNGNEQMAYGGILGDTKLNFRYLFENQGKGPGNRIFIGSTLLIPSSYTITESPWVKSEQTLPDGTVVNTYTPHRHFYLSDGAYKLSAEIQYFKKRVKIPVFWGGTFSYSFPLNKSEYGFKPSDRYELSMMALSGPLKNVKSSMFMLSSIGLNYTIAYAGPSEWNGVRTPNSEAFMHIPGISLLFGSNAGTFGVNIQKGYEEYLQKTENDIKEENSIYSVSISYRKVLDKYIDKLYWK